MNEAQSHFHPNRQLALKNRGLFSWEAFKAYGCEVTLPQDVCNVYDRSAQDPGCSDGDLCVVVMADSST